MERTAMMKLIDMLDLHIESHKDKAGKFDVGAMIARNYAKNLLEMERLQLESAFDSGVVGDEFSSYEYYLKKYGDGKR